MIHSWLSHVLSFWIWFRSVCLTWPATAEVYLDAALMLSYPGFLVVLQQDGMSTCNGGRLFLQGFHPSTLSISKHTCQNGECLLTWTMLMIWETWANTWLERAFHNLGVCCSSLQCSVEGTDERPGWSVDGNPMPMSLHVGTGVVSGPTHCVP